MRRITIFTAILVILLTTSSFAARFGFGGGYMPGIPMTEAKWTEGTYLGETVEIDMTDGYPFKMGPMNFYAGAVFNIHPMIGIEGGMDYHMGYKNKEATIRGTLNYHGVEIPIEEDISEDDIKWRMMNFGGGARIKFPLGLISPYASGGFLLSFTKVVELDGDGDETDDYSKATHLGVYFGGGMNIFFTDKIAINIPVKYNMFFTGKHTFYVDGDEDEDASARIKPPQILTVGVGLEVYPF